MINRFYVKNLEKIKASFHEKKDFPHLVLFDFLDKTKYRLVEKEIQRISFSHEKKPLLHSYGSATVPFSLAKIFLSKGLVDFISAIIGKKLKLKNKPKLYSFLVGDYTLLNDSRAEKDGIDIIFDLTEHWDPSGGGAITYVDGTGDALKLPINSNSLMIVRRQRNMQRFVKYVNHNAGKKKRMFLFVPVQ